MSEKRYNTLKEVHADGITDRDKIRAVYAPKYKSISGLMNLAVYTSREYNKTIVLMGEAHIKTDLCDSDTATHPGNIMVTDFLFELLDCHKDVIVKDVYLESIYNPISSNKFYDYTIKPQHHSFMNDSLGKLVEMDCLRKDKNQILKACPYPNSRFHSCDIRGTFITKKTSLNPLRILVVIFFLLNYYKSGSIADLKNFYDYIHTLHIPKYDSIEDFIKDLYEDLKRLKIDKQLHKIDDPAVVYIIREYMNKYIDKLRHIDKDNLDINNIYKNLLLLHEHNIILDSIRSGLDKIVDPNLRSELTQIHKKIMDINSIDTDTAIMDGYLMSRVFRTFKGGIKPKNIIIYAGGYHIINHIKILEKLGFEKKFHGAGSEDKLMCLDVTGFRVEWLL